MQDPETYLLALGIEEIPCAVDPRRRAVVGDVPVLRVNHELFVFAAGPHVPRGKRVDREAQQVQVTSTVGALLGLEAPHWEAGPLDELLT